MKMMRVRNRGSRDGGSGVNGRSLRRDVLGYASDGRPVNEVEVNKLHTEAGQGSLKRLEGSFIAETWV